MRKKVSKSEVIAVAEPVAGALVEDDVLAVSPGAVMVVMAAS
jgi:hypothetical protein